MREVGLSIPEVEFSVTAACSLACAECGFFVPEQPAPTHDTPARELQRGLTVLDALGVEVRSLAIVGGEATLAPRALADVLGVARAAPNLRRIELVTNGLTPKGLLATALPQIDRLSLSDYTGDDALSDAWRTWLASRAPDVEFVRRRHDRWDVMREAVDLGEAGGQSAYDTCWYRRHCVTIERGRLFVCSRIPKLGRDDEGLPLTAETTRAQLEAYLYAPKAPPSCRTCAQMAGLPTVEPGLQPDDRLPRLRGRALAWFVRQEESR